MAASVTGRVPVLYMTFDDAELAQQLYAMVASLTALDCSVAELYSWIAAFECSVLRGRGGASAAADVFAFIMARAAGSPVN